ncbi:hypothetical protein [Thermogemmatispora sp.]|uniref:hypothetical protein n=1 Tax=Thermogemmatispora sp. TaxID=1968838 RepID=UPI003A1009B8
MLHQLAIDGAEITPEALAARLPRETGCTRHIGFDARQQEVETGHISSVALHVERRARQGKRVLKLQESQERLRSESHAQGWQQLREFVSALIDQAKKAVVEGT